ncbi:MAG: hypothetical protein M9907_18510 [Burkholderiaceae bacterium]|nr:hypothetical protein [Burkholderiaceae bacterium]
MTGAEARILPRLDLLPPDLGLYGYVCRRRWPGGYEYGPRLRDLRPGTADYAAAVDEIGRALRVLARCAGPLPRRGPDRRGVNSYRLKHDVERRAGRYVANGAAIAACLLLGIDVQREAADGPNALCAVALTGEL